MLTRRSLASLASLAALAGCSATGFLRALADALGAHRWSPHARG